MGKKWKKSGTACSTCVHINEREVEASKESKIGSLAIAWCSSAGSLIKCNLSKTVHEVSYCNVSERKKQHNVIDEEFASCTRGHRMAAFRGTDLRQKSRRRRAKSKSQDDILGWRF